MIADIQKSVNGYTARFERDLKHSVEAVWAMLTENDKLATWFSELRIDELREGGVIKFDMQDGTYMDMHIIELKTRSIFEFTWDKDVVRFELYPQQVGCKLVLTEKIKTITNQTKKDLAGWHVCLDVIQALLDGTVIARDEEWKKWFEKYDEAVAIVTK